jgi:hypothetical protein
MPRGDPRRKRRAIYTRKSSEEGLEQEFQLVPSAAQSLSSSARGWVTLPPC